MLDERVTSLSMANSQILPETGFLIVIYEDDMSLFLRRSYANRKYLCCSSVHWGVAIMTFLKKIENDVVTDTMFKKTHFFKHKIF